MISHSILFRIRNVLDKTLSKNSKHMEVASDYQQAEPKWIMAI
jgi:hypothetical protein